MRRIIVATAILLQCSARADMAALNEVTWMLPEYPPIFITEKALQGQGYGDGELRFLTSHLTQYHHLVLYATAPRLWHEMETRDGVCSISVAKLPEREKFAVFSARRTLGIANQLIIRADRRSNFEPYLDKGRIDLKRFAADARLLGGYADGTTYGPALDAFIRDPLRKTPLEVTAHIRSPIGLVEKQRLDFAFGYYMEMVYYRRTHPEGAELMTIPTLPESTRQDAYIACSKGPRGRQIVAAIDALLASDEAMQEFVEPVRDWYSPAEFDALLKDLKPAAR